MSLSGLPPELLQSVAAQADERDLNALVRVSRPFYHLLNPFLYRRNNAQSWPDVIAVEWATEHGRVETILRAEAVGIDIQASNQLPMAASFGTLSTVEFFFERVCREGAPPDFEHHHPLIVAIESGHSKTVRDARANGEKCGQLDVAKFLIEKGVDLDRPHSAGGRTALHLTVDYGDLTTTELLLKHGANVDPLTPDQRTPLLIACRLGLMNIMELLLEHGANVDAADREGETPLHVAAQDGDVVLAEMLLRWGADVNARDIDEWTPLLVAVEGDQPEMARFLIENGGQ